MVIKKWLILETTLILLETKTIVEVEVKQERIILQEKTQEILIILVIVAKVVNLLV